MNMSVCMYVRTYAYYARSLWYCVIIYFSTILEQYKKQNGDFTKDTIQGCVKEKVAHERIQ